jgi:aspartate-semialdehyde dehydrogenase
MKKIAIIGATGATGFELIKLALSSGVQKEQILPIASSKSVGKKIQVNEQEFEIQPLDVLFEASLDVIFLAAGGKISSALKDKLMCLGAFVIDLSSKFRQDKQIPLIVPEINPDAFDPKIHKWVSSPNCVTTIYLMVLAPILKKYKAKKILLSTYQAASGAGYQAMEELKKETHAFLNDISYQNIAFKDPFAFNLFCHNAPFITEDDNDEELKIRLESQKILNDESLNISATCVRVPTLRAHAVSLYVEFSESISKKTLYDILQEAPGIKKYEDFEQNLFATPQIASCQNEVYYGRIRKDVSCENSFWFWIVGDQLLKGASLNAWQIFQLKESYETLHSHARSTSAFI